MRAAVLLVVLVSVAHADDASALFKRGVDALRARDYAAATTAFQQSYALSPKEATMCNLALTYDRWPGHVAEAIESYRKCAEDDTSGRFRDHALVRARQLREQLAATPPVEQHAEPGPESPKQPAPPPTVAAPTVAAPPVAAPTPPVAAPTLPPAAIVQSAPPAPRTRPFFHDGAAVTLTALGVLGIAGGVGIAVAGQLDDKSIASTDDLGQKAALYNRAGVLEPAGYAVLAVGGALIVAGVVEWAVHGRHVQP